MKLIISLFPTIFVTTGIATCWLSNKVKDETADGGTAEGVNTLIMAGDLYQPED